MMRKNRSANPTASSDDGFTLIELLVYSVLLVLVVTIVGGLLINMLRAQSSVTTVTAATTSGQSAANSIQAGIRNATAFKIVASGTDQLLVAKTVLADAAATQVCVAWYFSSSGTGAIRYTRLASPLAAVPTSATVATWTLLQSGVVPASGTTIFSRSSPTDPLLNVGFTATAGSRATVTFSSSVASRAGGGNISSCYSGV